MNKETCLMYDHSKGLRLRCSNEDSVEGVKCSCCIQILSCYVLVMRVQVHRIIMGNFTSRLGNSGHHACVRMALNLFMVTVCVSPLWSSAIYILGYNSGTLLCVMQRDFYCYFWKLPLLFPKPSCTYGPLLLVLMGILLKSHSICYWCSL